MKNFEEFTEMKNTEKTTINITKNTRKWLAIKKLEWDWSNYELILQKLIQFYENNESTGEKAVFAVIEKVPKKFRIDLPALLEELGFQTESEDSIHYYLLTDGNPKEFFNSTKNRLFNSKLMREMEARLADYKIHLSLVDLAFYQKIPPVNLDTNLCAAMLRSQK